MLRTILVPLDGSGFGEQALPVALRIAATTHARIELLHVYEHPLAPVYGGRAPVRDPRTDAELRTKHETYVPALAARLGKETSIAIDFALPEGEVVRRIIEHADRPDVGLIVMTTHGRTGLNRVWLGSVADSVVRSSSVPVLLVRPSAVDGSAETREFNRVLVALDGSRTAEEALEEAVRIGSPSGTHYQLLQVVPPYEPPAIGELGVAAAVGSPGAEKTALAYVETVAEEARSRGIRASALVMTSRSVGRAIVEAATEWHADLIAMTTHGRKGAGRLLLGSVAEKVMHSAHVPVLVVRPAFERATDDFQSVGGLEGGNR